MGGPRQEVLGRGLLVGCRRSSAGGPRREVCGRWSSAGGSSVGSPRQGVLGRRSSAGESSAGGSLAIGSSVGGSLAGPRQEGPGLEVLDRGFSAGGPWPEGPRSGVLGPLTVRFFMLGLVFRCMLGPRLFGVFRHLMRPVRISLMGCWQKGRALMAPTGLGHVIAVAF